MKPNFIVRNRMSGYFTFAKGKVDAAGMPIPGTESVVASFPNLITNNGLDKIYSCPGGSFGLQYLFPYCVVGTGNTPPANTDTTLASYLAISTINEDSGTTTFIDDISLPYWKHVKVFRFNAGVATGNLTEVGTAWSSTNLFSRALILDGGGVPTTITVLSDEYVDVTYEFRNYIDITEYPATITVSGTAHDILYKPSDIDNAPVIRNALSDTNITRSLTLYETGTLGTVYTGPAGTGTVKTGTWSSYTSGNYYADITFSYALGDANFTLGIGSAVFICSQGKFQFNLDPHIMKTSSMILSLVLRFTWDRYP